MQLQTNHAHIVAWSSSPMEELLNTGKIFMEMSFHWWKWLSKKLRRCAAVKSVRESSLLLGAWSITGGGIIPPSSEDLRVKEKLKMKRKHEHEHDFTSVLQIFWYMLFDFPTNNYEMIDHLTPLHCLYIVNCEIHSYLHCTNNMHTSFPHIKYICKQY